MWGYREILNPQNRSKFKEQTVKTFSTNAVLEYPFPVWVPKIRQCIKENFDRSLSLDYWGSKKKGTFPLNKDEQCVSQQREHHYPDSETTRAANIYNYLSYFHMLPCSSSVQKNIAVISLKLFLSLPLSDHIFCWIFRGLQNQ